VTSSAAVCGVKVSSLSEVWNPFGGGGEQHPVAGRAVKASLVVMLVGPARTGRALAAGATAAISCFVPQHLFCDAMMWQKTKQR
jgi:hypothetical protein